MGVGEVVVHLEGVGELDGRFFGLAFIRVALSALEVALLLLIGIAMATYGETKCKRCGQDCGDPCYWS